MAKNIQELQSILKTFYQERDWEKFHDPKSLCMALSAEVGELSEKFQWLTAEQAKSVMETSPRTAQEIREEMADVFAYLITLAAKLGIDLIEASTAKIEQNRVKYPVEKSKGVSTKYNEL